MTQTETPSTARRVLNRALSRRENPCRVDDDLSLIQTDALLALAAATVELAETASHNADFARQTVRRSEEITAHLIRQADELNALEKDL